MADVQFDGEQWSTSQFYSKCAETSGLIDRLDEFSTLVRQAYVSGDKRRFHRMMAEYSGVWDQTQENVNAIGRAAIKDAIEGHLHTPMGGVSAGDLQHDLVHRFARHTGDLQAFMADVNATNPQFLIGDSGSVDADRRKSLPKAGWYPDPERYRTKRYWDGARWTDRRKGMHAQGGETPLSP